jgi:hypothetical protein
MAFVLLGSGLGGLRCRKVWRVLAALAMWAPAVVLVLGTLAVRRAARMPALVAS